MYLILATYILTWYIALMCCLNLALEVWPICCLYFSGQSTNITVGKCHFCYVISVGGFGMFSIQFFVQNSTLMLVSWNK